MPACSGARGGDRFCRPVAFTVISTFDPDFSPAAALIGVARMNSASRSNQRSCVHVPPVGMQHGTVPGTRVVSLKHTMSAAPPGEGA